MPHAPLRNDSWHRPLATCAGILMLGWPCVGADPPVRVYQGLCDASAAVWLDANTFAVADDEDNVIRVYGRQGSGAPLRSVDLSAFLRVDDKEAEADIEGAARIGKLVFWITSHGRNAGGKQRPSRQRFFATRVLDRSDGVHLRPTGRPYTGLLRDLASDPRLRRFNLTAAATLPPKDPGALNIEGLAATPQGHLFIGFRNPIPHGRALLVPLLNPSGLIVGAPARLGEPALLNLGGRGLRSITEWGSRYLIIAGSADGGGASKLYLWTGPGHEPQLLTRPAFGTMNPEALAFSPDTGQHDLLVVSDDGAVPIGDCPCKKLKDPLQKRFRALILPENALSLKLTGPVVN
jgi:hypothetical protein